MTKSISVDFHDAYEVITSAPDERVPHADVLFTCEHASQLMPHPWRWLPEDAWLIGTHWAFDLGAANFARELARAFRTTTVLSRFSRLLADPNRSEDSPEIFRNRGEGRDIAMNQNLDSAERERRLDATYRRYHGAVSRAAELVKPKLIFGVHTFTPLYEGKPRDLEVGILFDHDDELAGRLHHELLKEGFHSALNEPYSGKDGLIYAVDRHASEAGVAAVEIELRYDMALNTGARRRICVAMERAFSDL